MAQMTPFVCWGTSGGREVVCRCSMSRLQGGRRWQLLLGFSSNVFSRRLRLHKTTNQCVQSCSCILMKSAVVGVFRIWWPTDSSNAHVCDMLASASTGVQLETVYRPAAVLGCFASYKLQRRSKACQGIRILGTGRRQEWLSHLIVL